MHTPAGCGQADKMSVSECTQAHSSHDAGTPEMEREEVEGVCRAEHKNKRLYCECARMPRRRLGKENGFGNRFLAQGKRFGYAERGLDSLVLYISLS